MKYYRSDFVVIYLLNFQIIQRTFVWRLFAAEWVYAHVRGRSNIIIYYNIYLAAATAAVRVIDSVTEVIYLEAFEAFLVVVERRVEIYKVCVRYTYTSTLLYTRLLVYYYARRGFFFYFTSLLLRSTKKYIYHRFYDVYNILCEHNNSDYNNKMF